MSYTFFRFYSLGMSNTYEESCKQFSKLKYKKKTFHEFLITKCIQFIENLTKFINILI